MIYWIFFFLSNLNVNLFDAMLSLLIQYYYYYYYWDVFLRIWCIFTALLPRIQ